MMDRKWTPGKWSVYEVEGVTHWPGIEAGSTSVVVWGSEMENNGIQGNTLDEARANAHLISAAPDMYEALDKVDRWFNGSETELGMILRQAVIALAKARGETQ